MSGVKVVALLVVGLLVGDAEGSKAVGSNAWGFDVASAWRSTTSGTTGKAGKSKLDAMKP